MSIKSFISAQVSAFVLDERRLEKTRAKAEQQRQRAGEPHRIEFFHQVDDPYSYLLAQALLKLEERYEVEVVTWLVEPPDEWAAPERELLEAYSLVDAERLAKKAGFEFCSPDSGPEARPSPASVLAAQKELSDTLAAPDQPGGRATLEATIHWGKRHWVERDWGERAGESSCAGASGGGESGGEAKVHEALRAGSGRRDALGHYLGGTCFYGGEWTWGIDRLEYLEERLTSLSARKEAGEGARRAIYERPHLLEEPVSELALEGAQLPDLHFFASFRSPYTYIVTERVIRLAETFGVNLQIRFVLPMVMRGLPVKRSKRFYILHDAAREARRNGVPFGPIADPVGEPVERGYSLLPWAIEQGKGAEYSHSFLTHVWSKGVDAGSDRGLRGIVEAAGLSWQEARTHLGDEAWRQTAEQNRRELFELGLWGVPSFRVSELAVWGQDRLWALEDEYRRLLGG